MVRRLCSSVGVAVDVISVDPCWQVVLRSALQSSASLERGSCVLGQDRSDDKRGIPQALTLRRVRGSS